MFGVTMAVLEREKSAANGSPRGSPGRRSARNTKSPGSGGEGGFSRELGSAAESSADNARSSRNSRNSRNSLGSGSPGGDMQGGVEAAHGATFAALGGNGKPARRRYDSLKSAGAKVIKVVKKVKKFDRSVKKNIVTLKLYRGVRDPSCCPTLTDCSHSTCCTCC